MPRQIPTQANQQGVAALTVTILLTLIATVAAVYASKSSLITQKAAENSYQNVIAAQAAENGMNAYIEQLRLDMIELAKPTPGNTVLLKKANPPTSGATGCGLTGSAIATYELKNPTEYLTAIISEVVAVGNVDQQSAYRVNAQFAANGTLNITSEGCTGNPSDDTGQAICSNSNLPKAILRKNIKTATSIDPGNNTLTVKGHMDSRTTLNISPIDTNKPPSCGVLYGDGGRAGCTAPSVAM